MPFEAQTSTGRIVQGNPLIGRHDKDDDGKLKFNDDGTPKLTYFVGLAFDKQDPAWSQLYQQIWQEGMASFPHLFNQQTGQCTRQDFSWKIADGDGFDNNGKPNSAKEGFAGHMILKLSSSYPFRCFDTAGQQSTVPEMFAKGCYARASIKVLTNGANKATQKPGLYVNVSGFQLVGYGTPISSGPDFETLFTQPVNAGFVPAGMSLTPVANTQPMPGMQQAPMGMQQQPMQQMAPQPMQQMAPQPQQMAPQPQQAPMGMQQQPMQQMAPQPQQMAPAAAMPGMVPMGRQPQMQQPMQQQAPQQMAPQPMQQMAPMQQQAPQPMQQMAQPNQQFVQQAVAPVFIMTPGANGYTREQYHQNGYDDATLIASGLMVMGS